MSANHLFRPQVEFCTVNGRVMMDDIVRFESFDADMTRVFAALSLSWQIGKVANKSSHLDYREYFDSDTKVDLVRRLYSSDIAAFGYEYGGD